MIDHIIYGVPDLTTAVDEIEEQLGVRPALGGKHPGRGHHNALLNIGDSCYLEIIAPDPDQGHEGPLPFSLHLCEKPQILAWATLTSDIEAAVARSRAAGHDPGEIGTMERRAPNGAMLRWRITSVWHEPPYLTPFLVDPGDTPHPAHAAPAGARLVEFHAEHPDPDRIAASLRAMEVDLPVNRAQEPALVAVFDTPRGRIEFR